MFGKETWRSAAEGEFMRHSGIQADDAHSVDLAGGFCRVSKQQAVGAGSRRKRTLLSVHVRTVRDAEARTATSAFTQLRSSEAVGAVEQVFNPQRWLEGTLFLSGL